VDRYEAAMRWLREVASGDISPILPVLPTEEIKKSIVVKSQEKKQFDY
jgi:phage gp36-like protein